MLTVLCCPLPTSGNPCPPLSSPQDLVEMALLKEVAARSGQKVPTQGVP
jgi:hypothetical protein